MRAICLAVVLAAMTPGAARADICDPSDLLRRAESVVQWLVGSKPPDRELIAPPGNIDPKMALVPPPRGTMRIIPPPERFRQQ